MISLLELPPREARALLASGAPVYLAANPPEYHGPHLSLHNDALISAGLQDDLCRRLAARHPDWPYLSAGELELGVDPVPGPGSQHTPYPLARRRVLGAVQALHELGARRVVLMTFHGGPLHNLALDAGVRWLERRGVSAFAPMCVLLRELLSFEEARLAPALALALAADRGEEAAFRRSLSFDFHAGFIETSLALHYVPASVSPAYRELVPSPEVVPRRGLSAAARLASLLRLAGLARDLGFGARALGWYGLRPFPGYTGHPHRASAAAGAIIAAAVAEMLDGWAERVLAGEARTPPPILAYLRFLTLGGRLTAVGVPREAQTYREEPVP